MSLSSKVLCRPVSVARTCNLILIVLDVLKPLGHKKLIEHELEGFGIRLNKNPPNIGFKRKDKGGINFTATVRMLHSRPGEATQLSLDIGPLRPSGDYTQAESMGKY